MLRRQPNNFECIGKLVIGQRFSVDLDALVDDAHMGAAVGANS